jgi:hypothetical protein
MGTDLEQAPPSRGHAMRNTEHRGSDARKRQGGDRREPRKLLLICKLGLRGLYVRATEASTRKEYRGEVQVRVKELRANEQLMN